MARREKKESGGGGGGGWIVTFSDLMTLLLTFFVLLLSMSSMDQRRSQEAQESVSEKFNLATISSEPAARDPEAHPSEPGVMEVDSADMSPLRQMVFEDTTQDLDFQENRYVQILSIQNEVLFPPGGMALKPEGMVLLDRLVPYLVQLEYPLLIAGHTSPRRDEEGAGYTLNRGATDADATWLLSYRRALAVYRHFIARGLDASKLTLEAFGQFHPRFTTNTPEGRAKNRRVDLVLDKRNKEWLSKVEQQRPGDPKRDNTYQYNNFEFDLRMPGDPSPGPRAPSGWGRP